MKPEDAIWRILREQGRYNLIWLAGKTGFSHSHVKAVATGKFPPSADFRAACAGALDIPADVLFTSPGAASRREVVS